MKRISKISLFVFLCMFTAAGLFAADPSLTGKVVETMDSGGYTYVAIDRNGEKIWAAVPKSKVTKGQTISLQPGAEMRNFESKTLNRKFEKIIFSGGVIENAGQKKEEVSAGSKAQAVASDATIKVKKASGANAYTIAEVYEKIGKLNTKAIVVRGKVVKVSAAIMGKNWIHLQDGSGDPNKGNSDLVVTSNELPSVGDVVTASGTVLKDKDFGGGYKYAVIMENSAIKK